MAVGDAFENAGPDVGVDFDVFVCVFWFEFYDLADAEWCHFEGWEWAEAAVSSCEILS